MPPRNHQYVAVRGAEFVLARRLEVGAGFLRPILCREDFVPLQIVGKGMLETSRLSGAGLITHAGHAYSVCSESRRYRAINRKYMSPVARTFIWACNDGTHPHQGLILRSSPVASIVILQSG